MTIELILGTAILILILYVVAIAVDEIVKEIRGSRRPSSPHPFRGGVRNDGGEGVGEGVPWYCQGAGYDGECVDPHCTCIHAEMGRARRIVL